MNDRFGLGWRPELAAGILSNLNRIDVVEVIANGHGKPRCELIQNAFELSAPYMY